MSPVVRHIFSNKKKAARNTMAAEIPIPGYQLKIELAFSDPSIWRSVQVPGTMTLAGLHQTIQHCMGWSNAHAHQFLVGKIFYKPKPVGTDKDADSEYDEANIELHQLQEGMKFIFTYLYDAGDGWECEITLETTLPPDEVVHPVLVAGERACPPENLHDIHEYQQILEEIENLGEAAAEQTRTNYGLMKNFDPDFYDPSSINTMLMNISR